MNINASKESKANKGLFATVASVVTVIALLLSVARQMGEISGYVPDININAGKELFFAVVFIISIIGTIVASLGGGADAQGAIEAISEMREGARDSRLASDRAYRAEQYQMRQQTTDYNLASDRARRAEQYQMRQQTTDYNFASDRAYRAGQYQQQAAITRLRPSLT